jgi:c(7)-type cytochrome triheme protein
MKKMIVLAMAVVMTLAFATLGFSLKKDIEFKTVGDEGKVTFSHEIHTEKKGMKCNECHPKLFKMKKGDDTVTMAAIKEGKFCGSCHDGKKAFDANAADNCGKCHKK